MGKLPVSLASKQGETECWQNPSVTEPCGNLPVNQSFCLATIEGWRSSLADTPSPASPGPTETVSVTVPTTVSVTVSTTASVTVPATVFVTVPATVSVLSTLTTRVPVTVPVTVSVTVPTTVRVTVATVVPTTVVVSVPVTIAVTVTNTIRTTVTSTTTALGSGPTPLPYQPGMVGNCKAFYFVQWGDTCDSIAAKFGVRSDQIVAWNPQARSDCTRLLAETFCCVRAF